MESDNYSLADFIEYNHPDIFKKTELFYEFYTDYKNKASFTFFRPLLTASGPKVTIRDNHTGKKKEMIMMASNNYLGLASRPEVIEAGKKALEKYGISLGGSPFLCGYSDLHEELEKKLAEFKNCEDTVIFPSGFATNVGTISSLARRNDIIFSDRLDHASIIDGSIFSGSKMRGFRHNDLCQLEKRLQKQQNSQGGKLIIVEGIYSMDGDLAPLDKIKKLATTYNARLMVDEAHATGVLGKNGKGAIEHFGLEGEIDLVIGTFSKTFGAQGGFVCTTKETATYIRCYGRPYLFSASLSPVIVASVLKSLEIIQNEPQLREKLWDNIRYMKKICS